MHAGMRLPVTDQSRLLRERLAANITDVRTFARVDEQVLPISCATRERLATDVAIVRPVPGVHHHVLLQPVILRERFAALLADEALAPFVLKEYMLIKILLRDHPSLADLALVLGFEVRPFLMNVQRVAIGASLPTNIANDRTLFMLEPDV